MDKEIWRLISTTVDIVSRRVCRKRRYLEYSDRLIVKMYLWATWHDRPLCWACVREHYNSWFRPRQLPSISQFSRRVRGPCVEAILRGVHAQLIAGKKASLLSFLDGKPLLLGSHTRDPDARLGWATNGFAVGYKLHAWATDDGYIRDFTVRSLNEGEAKVARDLTSQIPDGSLVLADANYDSKHTYNTVGERGAQLVTPLKKRAQTEKARRRMGRFRQYAVWLFEKHQHLHEELTQARKRIERIFSNLTCFGGGLAPLPPWVRRLERVRRWVTAKILVYHARLIQKETMN